MRPSWHTGALFSYLATLLAVTVSAQPILKSLFKERVSLQVILVMIASPPPLPPPPSTPQRAVSYLRAAEQWKVRPEGILSQMSQRHHDALLFFSVSF